MIRLTKMVTDPKYWTEELLGDSKVGNIPVEYKQEIRVAKPIFNPMSLQVITKEFVAKYGEGLGVYLTVDPEGILWWSGFCLFKNNNLFDTFEEDYPNLKIKHFDESWMEIFSSSEGRERWEIKSLTQKISSLKIDLAEKLISINNQEINGIQFEENQTLINEAKKLILGGASTVTIDSEGKKINLDNVINGIDIYEDKTVIREDSSLELGEGATEPFVLGETLSNWLTDLMESVTKITHISSSPGTPTSPPVNVASFEGLKAQIPNIVSKIIKGK